MKYVIDEIIDDIVILENLENSEKIEVNLNELPPNIQEGNILIKKNIYEIDKNTEVKRREIIQNKLNRLKRKNYE